MSLAEWEARHRAGPPLQQPSPVLIAAAQVMRPGRALDLACGTGRHALWLAARGWRVTAVDGSRTAIEILEDQAAQRGLSIDARVADLEKGEFVIEPQSWELIAACYYLQRDLFAPIKEGLVPGGVAVAIALMGNSRYGAQPGELRAYFTDWEILADREEPDASGHLVAAIAARKPSRGATLPTKPPAR